MTFKTVAVLCAGLTFGSASAQQPTEPYSVSVWARVQFGHDGHAEDISIVDADQYPAGFIKNVRQRLERARVPPPVVDGKPALLKSGVELRFAITPTETGGNVRIEGINIGPIPTKKYYANYPEELKRSAAWEGEIRGTCTVSVQGRCSSIDVVVLPGMPESAKKFAKASLEKWEFEPQQLNGQPIEGEYEARFQPLTTKDAMPEKFNEDKFLRILRAREK